MKVKTTDWGAIGEMYIVKDGQGFKLEGDPDEDCSHIEVFAKGKMKIPLEIEENLRPGDKIRPTSEQKITKYVEN